MHEIHRTLINAKTNFKIEKPQSKQKLTKTTVNRSQIHTSESKITRTSPNP